LLFDYWFHQDLPSMVNLDVKISLRGKLGGRFAPLAFGSPNNGLSADGRAKALPGLRSLFPDRARAGRTGVRARASFGTFGLRPNVA